MSPSQQERTAALEATHDAENIDERVVALEKHVATLNAEMGRIDGKVTLLVALNVGLILALIGNALAVVTR